MRLLGYDSLTKSRFRTVIQGVIVANDFGATVYSQLYLDRIFLSDT